MANLILVSTFLSFLLLFHGCFARNAGQLQQNECLIRSINAVEPRYRVQAEAGVSEFWDADDDQFRCAGVAAIRHIIQPRGLSLPHYHNAPLLIYVVQGSGMHGLLTPGCPETFQSSQGSEQYGEGRGETSQRFDRHQKVEQIREGDVLAIPAGVAHWTYNDGDRELVLVVLFDTGNNANQLDRNQRRFFLAGNLQGGQQQPQWRGERGESQPGQKGRAGFGNVFRGFDVQTLVEAFGVDERTARKLQGEDDDRGHIVRVEQGLRVIRPPFGGRQGREGREEEEPYGPRNGIEETICSARYRENIDRPSRADIYNPRAGRFKTLNSFTLPLLRYLQLSVERGVLYRNAIFAPQWYMNCHNVMYVTRGESRVQIVDHSGQAVFDGQLREGQIVVVPQNFAVVKHASSQGFEWVGFNTNDNAMINTLSGRTSAIRGLPVDVIANSYQISREEARRMKFSRDQTLIFESRRSGTERVASA